MSAFTPLNNSNSCNAEGMQVRSIKYDIDIIVSCLTNIFNNCLTTSIFPERMQLAKGIAINEKGDKNGLGNY